MKIFKPLEELNKDSIEESNRAIENYEIFIFILVNVLGSRYILWYDTTEIEFFEKVSC
jgi:hypothetical protein